MNTLQLSLIKSNLLSANELNKYLELKEDIRILNLQIESAYRKLNFRKISYLENKKHNIERNI